MKKAFIFWSCLLPILAVSAGSGSDFASKDMPGSQHQTEPPAASVPTPALTPGFGRIPLHFVPNHGQIDNPVRFYIQGADKTIYFAPDGVTFALSYSAKPKEEKEVRKLFQRPLYSDEKTLSMGKDLKRWTVKMDFMGARKDVKPEGLDKTGAIVSYFKGKPEEWKAGLPAYSKILYRDLWPGIDLVYKGDVNKLKYEFIVHPGADPSHIRLAYRGTERVEVTEEGRLRMTTPAGVFEDDTPMAYQEVEGKQRSVAMAYALKGPAKCETAEIASPTEGLRDEKLGNRNCVYGFEVGDYDRSKTLVLDPAVLVYCGYIGGSDEDRAYGIAIDASGNAYVLGITQSADATFPEKVGPDVTYNGGGDTFIAKVNSSATALVYCGYIGGSGEDLPSDIAVDASGNAHISGTTQSTETTFPVTVGPDLTYNGGDRDGFIAKVNSSGTALDFCGYIGGSNDDSAGAIAVDDSGYIYVGGGTHSTESTFAVKAGPDLTYNGGDGDGFVAKINPSGTKLVYCGYIGGSGFDYVGDMAVDDADKVYLAGSTHSTESTFPVKVGPDLTYNGDTGNECETDLFVAKLSSSGTAFVYCGYVGGWATEWSSYIAIDDSGNAYVGGYTGSDESTFPVKVGPDLTYNGDRSDGWVAKVNPSGSGLVYCGYVGGSGDEGFGGIAVDKLGNAYFVGSTLSTEATFPVTLGPDLTYNGGGLGEGDAYVAKVNSSGTALVYCGYIGGSAGENGGHASGGAIAVDNSGNAYVVGTTNSSESSFPVAKGPDLTFNGTNDVFVAKVSPSGVTFSLGASPSSATVTAGQSASYTVTVTPEGGSFDSSVSFSCTGLPSKCTSSLSPASVTPGKDAATTTLTLATQASSASGVMFGPIALVPPALASLLVILVLILWFSLRRSAQARPWQRWLATGVLIFLVVFLVRCGTKDNGDDGNQPGTGTPKGTYDISVKGESGSLSASTSVTLIVN